MKSYSREILTKIQKELALIDLEDCHVSIEESAEMIGFLNECMVELRTFFFSLESISKEDEIFFFKEIKPEILGFLLYFNKIHTIELKCPNGSNDTLIEYYENEQSGTIGQLGFGFSLILLSKYGNTERSERYYADKYFKAFPMLLETVQPTYGTVQDYCFNCYCLRTFERFLYHSGLVEIKKGKRILHEETYIQKTPLFDRLISLVSHREFEMR